MREPAGVRRVPGWYQDPSDPTRLRYWGERGWTNRRRPRPGWELSSAEWTPPDDAEGGPGGGPVLEGPVQPAELPTIAAAVSGARDALTSPTTGLSGGGRRVGGAGRSGGRAGRIGQQWTAHDDGLASWPAPRRPVMIFCLLSVLALVAMVTTVGLARTGRQGSAVLTDQGFVAQANAACAGTLPALRITTNTGAATTAHAQGIDRLANRLGQLPVAGGDRPHVQAWLADWQRYAQDQQLGTGTPPDSQFLADGSLAQSRADSFAVANGIIECTLSDHPDTSGAQPY
jgi:hypothetical protein